MFVSKIGIQFKYLYLLMKSNVTISIFLRFMMSRFKIALKVLIKRKDSPSIRAVMEGYKAAIANKEFSNSWFDNNIPNWVKILAPLKENNVAPRICEIGSWEGRSTLFFSFYFPMSNITVIDMWSGKKDINGVDLFKIAEQRFDRNLMDFSDRLTKIKNNSSVAFSKLVTEGKKEFDLIYIDGSHYADNVLVDAILAWQLLAIDGTIIFDDYTHIYTPYGWSKNVAQAVNLFLRLIAGEYKIIMVSNQLIVRKLYRPIIKSR